MADYYSILTRAVTTPGAGDAQWRHGIYDRARQMLADQIRARRTPSSMAEAAAEQAELEAAIERIEAELSRAGAAGNRSEGPIEPERGPIAKASRPSGLSWLVLAVIVAALGAGGLVYWEGKGQKSGPPALKSEAVRPAPPPPSATKVATANDGDLAAGIDGGSSDPDQDYVFRRQSTFYRTLQPAGTIIIDKLQHFLYLIRPNNVAVRYGIGLGGQCRDLAGLKHVASMAEWPQWQATPDMIERKLAKPGVMAGGAGNPLGARVLELDDGKSRINGTNAPKTIGTTVIFGCIRLVNDDVVDLYSRVQTGTAVIID